MSIKQDNTLVIVTTNRSLVVVFYGKLHQEVPLPYSAQELLLEYQNVSSGIYVVALLMPVAYKDAIQTAMDYIRQEESKVITPPDKVDNLQSNIEFLTPPIMEIKSSIMKNMRNKAEEATGNVLTNLRGILIAGISLTAGTIHFGLETSADLVAFGEAKSIRLLGERSKTTQELMDDRRRVTKETQQIILNIPDNIKEQTAKLRESMELKVAEMRLAKLKKQAA